LAIKRKLAERKKGSGVNIKIDDERRELQGENQKKSKAHHHSLQEEKMKSPPSIFGKLNSTVNKKSFFLSTDFHDHSRQRGEDDCLISRRKENTIGYTTSGKDVFKTLYSQNPKDKPARGTNGEHGSVKSRVELYNKPEQASYPLKSYRQSKQRVSLPLYIENSKNISEQKKDRSLFMKPTTSLPGDSRKSPYEMKSYVTTGNEKIVETRKADRLFVESNAIYPTPSRSTPLETEKENQPTECNMVKFNQSDANRKASLKKMGSCKVIVVTEDGLKSEYVRNYCFCLSL
jgi:hypothetical protein